MNMGNVLHSDKTCADTALHIASEMKKMICQNIILTKTKISILIDESTTLSKLSTLVVVVRAFIEDFPGKPYTFNLDLIPLLKLLLNHYLIVWVDTDLIRYF